MGVGFLCMFLTEKILRKSDEKYKKSTENSIEYYIFFL